MQMHVPVAAFNELPDKSDAKQGMQAMVEDFGVGKMFPIRVLLEFNGDSIYEKETVHTVFEITQKLKQLDGVSDVLGYTSLDGQFTSAEQYEQLYANLDQAPQAVREKLKSMVSSDEHKTVIYALPTFAPNTAEAREVVQEIRNLLSDHSNGTYKAYVSGETAMGMDYDSKIMKQIPIVVTVSLIFTFLLLLIAFRSIILPIKAIILNGLVTISTLGFLVFMFQNGNLPGTTPQALNVNTPVLLFCILFGLSIDYEVILVSRIREYYKRSGNNQESIVNGFVSTAGMINGAAAIMVTVFGMFVFADIQIVQELGVGLALAILLDAIVVRTIIVPLSMKLLGRMNWWIPFSKSKKG
jgi:RND superfamily putative drug exporter